MIIMTDKSTLQNSLFFWTTFTQILFMRRLLITYNFLLQIIVVPISNGSEIWTC
jgi:hypothetical protein